MIAGKTEEEVYKAIGLPLIPPEMREDQGEIKHSSEVEIIEYDDIKGDLHCHSDWNGGANSIEEMIKYSQKMGYEYLGISDHTQFLKIEHGLNEKELLKQKKAIEKINEKLKKSGSKFRVLFGCESNILNDGSIDIKDEVLEKMDYVIAGVHSNLKMDKKRMMERIKKAMENPNVDIISHPTGRLIQRRDEYQVDLDEMFKIAKKTGTILEINASPYRLDLKDTYIKKAKEAGVKMIIGSDAHHDNQMEYIEFGIGQARRGWAEKKDIINSQPLDKLLKSFK